MCIHELPFQVGEIPSSSSYHHNHDNEMLLQILILRRKKIRNHRINWSFWALKNNCWYKATKPNAIKEIRENWKKKKKTKVTAIATESWLEVKNNE